jgi:hypothetical protein
MLKLKTAFIALSLLLLSASVFAADTNANISIGKSPVGNETVIQGRGLESTVQELSRLGIDPAKLTGMALDGNVISLFTPGAQVQWKRLFPNTQFNSGLKPYSLADGTGSPGEVEVDVVRVGNTVMVFTWVYQYNSSTQSWGWQALGVVTYKVNTEKK